MLENENDLKDLIDKLDIDTKANSKHRENLRRKMLAAFDESHKPTRSLQTLRSIIMKSKITKLATAAVIIVAILIGLKLMSNRPESKPFVEIQPSPENKEIVKEPNDIEKQIVIARNSELEKIKKLYDTGDIDGLVTMLRQARFDESKVAAANYLAKIGDASAIDDLEYLASQWKGEPDNNPFAAAIMAIEERLEQQDKQVTVIESNEPLVAETTQIEPNIPIEQFDRCTGYVLNEQNILIPDAKVVLYYNHNRWGLGNKIVEEVISDVNGYFKFQSTIEFNRTLNHSYAQDSYSILATHPDYALGWYNIKQGRKQGYYELILTRPVSFTMTVTDHNEIPLAGARVWPYNIGDSDSLSESFRDYLKLPTDVGLIGGITDEKGRATITNLPKTRCSFYATLEGYSRALAFPGDNHIKLNRGADVYGRVLGDNGKPVEGVIVRFHAQDYWQFFLAKTDSEGYFAFEDMQAKGWDKSPWGQSQGGSGGYTVSIRHEKYTSQKIQLELFPDQLIDELIINAYSGTIVNCYVVEADSNEPVAGARVSGSNDSIGRIDGYTDANGLHSFRVGPGRTWITINSPPDGVYLAGDLDRTESSLQFDANELEMNVTLKMPPIAGHLTNVFGTILDPQGRPRGDAIVYARPIGHYAVASSRGYRSVGVNDDGQFELTGVPAMPRISIYTETKDRRFAGTGILEIPDEPNEPPYIEIHLLPTQRASKVIKFESGEPVANVSLEVRPVVEGEVFWFISHDEDTNEKGLLEIRGILPGLEYFLRDEDFIKKRRAYTKNGESTHMDKKIFKGNVVLIPLVPDPNE